MKFFPLNDLLENEFWIYMNKKVPDYFRAIPHFKNNRAILKIYLAYDEYIQGTMVIYYNKYVQLRGNKESISLMLSKVPNNIESIQLNEKHKDILLEKYSKVKRMEHDVLLGLNHANNKSQKEYIPSGLNESDKTEISDLLRKADPQEWNSIIPDQIPFGKNWHWIGIWINEHLVSCGAFSVNEFFGSIHYLATDPKFRREGFASSLISTILADILSRVPMVFVNARKKNRTALTLYKKWGFKVLRHFF
jgi:ribosomal protein S18 acetylase RimI-like enzyme